MRYRPTSINP
jgi:heme exporter protein D